MSHVRRRLDAIERAEVRRQYREVAAMARELHMSPAELLDEAEAFLSQPLAEQLAEVDRIHAESLAEGIPWDEAEEIKATLTEHYRP